jgi:adenosylcobinamide-phosphate synthase
VLIAAFALDVVFAEPPSWLHPVVWIGKLIEPLKRVVIARPFAAVLFGALYVVTLSSALVVLAYEAERALAPWPWLRFAFDTYLVWSCFALRSLIDAADGLRAALERGDLTESRSKLSWLCSRDASDLDASELAGAAIESLTENASDSVVAPLLFFALGGVPAIVLYRTINTFDAMVGYRGRFESLGKFAARLDDVANLVPARLTAFLLLAAGAQLRLDVRRGIAVWKRDRRRTESPNAGHPMAVAAGLLGVQLDKRDAYSLGAPAKRPGMAELVQAQRLTKIAGWLACALAVFMLGAFGGKH